MGIVSLSGRDEWVVNYIILSFLTHVGVEVPCEDVCIIVRVGIGIGKEVEKFLDLAFGRTYVYAGDVDRER